MFHVLAFLAFVGVLIVVAVLWLRHEVKIAPIVDDEIEHVEAELPKPVEQLVADATGVRPHPLTTLVKSPEARLQATAAKTAVPVTPKAA